MFLIMSGAYVGQELESEFGKLPPSFLPLGNRRLFQHQVRLAPEGTKIFLSLPETFSISSIDEIWLKENGVTLIFTPEKLSLGSSLVAALNLSGESLDKTLHVLYGDTLFKSLPTGIDIVSVSVAVGSYHWATLASGNADWIQDYDTKEVEQQKIIDGYFNFSQPRKLIQNIIQKQWDFIRGLNRYNKELGLQPVDSSGWLDFGHVNTYYNSKAQFTTQRAFNDLKITPEWIEKSSVKNDKIAAESNWFESIPYALKGNIPNYLGSNITKSKVSYRLEYLHLTALNELYVFSKLPSNIWTVILSSCIDFLATCRAIKSIEQENYNNQAELFTNKTVLRLKQYCESQGYNLNDRWEYNNSTQITLAQILDISNKCLPINSSNNSILHGDFCFSNILYDFRAGKIKTIDPRGISPCGKQTIYGDINYDVAKLSHSILGFYDYIVAGYFDVSIVSNKIFFELSEEHSHKETQDIYLELVLKEFQLSAKNIYAMQIQLFLSMLPLHSDNIERQNALFANAFRLYEILIRLDK